ncbi:conserved exported hypothetical protein [Paraburkholderia tropica]|uniref:hypothetical protein n=1 Tax=Paraburkholderia tropica TaxID=92647 RepID=UPI001CB42E5D|nr:hypothetical protein [Paraburkholderia tropica]CAG9236970.1 conserved exported hypothetical protein [Paraburkholderia tropica]
MKPLFLGAALAVACVVAHAQSAAVVCMGNVATLQINYSTGSDANSPGLFWLGLVAPDGSGADYLDTSGAWQPYQSGLIPPTGRYDTGLPPIVQATVALPGKPTNTYAMQGWIVGIGQGVLTQESQQQVDQRRAALDSVKPQLVAKGTWNPMLDDDDQFRWALAQGDMITNKKYVQALSIPAIDCMPSDTGNGGGT